MRMDQIPWQPAVSCEPDARVSEVYKQLKAHRCEAVLLVSSGRPVGYFTWNDLLAPLLAANGSWGQIAAGSYGHGSTFQASPDMDIERVLRRMRRCDLPIVAVTQNGKVVGMVSKADLASS